MNCFLLYHKKSKLQPVRMKIIIFFAKYLTNKFKTDFLRLLSQVFFIRLLCSLFSKTEILGISACVSAKSYSLTLYEFFNRQHSSVIETEKNMELTLFEPLC